MRKPVFHMSMQRLITLFIAAAMALFFFAAMVCLEQVKHHWEDQVLLNAQRNIELVAADWEQFINEVQKEALRLSGNAAISTYLRADDSTISSELLSENVSRQLFDAAMELDRAKSICIIKTADEYVIRNVYRYYFSDTFVQQFLSRRDMPAKAALEIEYNTYDQPFLLYILPLYGSTAAEHPGYLLLYMDIAALEGPFASLEKEYSGYALLDADARVLFSGGLNNVDEALQTVRQQSADTRTSTSVHRSQDSIVLVHQFGRGQWTIAQNISRTRLFYDVNRTMHMTTFVFILLSLLLFFSIRMVFSRYYKRIKQLNEAMSAVETGTLDIRHRVTGTDEIAQLCGHFNDMLDRLQDLIQNVSLKEASLREAQLLILRHQINPHFLYNTLETIRMLAVQQEETEIKDTVEALSDILRYSLDDSNNSCSFVGEEIAVIRQYVRIQDTRFHGRFTYAFDIDESICPMRMYKFLLQPLVENAFVHSITTTSRTSHLLITGRTESGLLSFTISNTGVPMEPDTLAMLQAYAEHGAEAGQKPPGLGLRNVIDRIHLYFGGLGAIEIQSSHACTSVTIRFPPL